MKFDASALACPEMLKNGQKSFFANWQVMNWSDEHILTLLKYDKAGYLISFCLFEHLYSLLA
jgi:hypothetical protein